MTAKQRKIVIDELERMLHKIYKRFQLEFTYSMESKIERRKKYLYMKVEACEKLKGDKNILTFRFYKQSIESLCCNRHVENILRRSLEEVRLPEVVTCNFILQPLVHKLQ